MGRSGRGRVSRAEAVIQPVDREGEVIELVRNRRRRDAVVEQVEIGVDVEIDPLLEALREDRPDQSIEKPVRLLLERGRY